MSHASVGIVTKFDLYTVPLHDLWYKGLSFPATSDESILAAIVQTQNSMENDDKAGIVIQAAAGVWQIIFLYAEHVGSTPTVFQTLDTLPGVNVSMPATNDTALNFSIAESAPEPPGL